jgi:hypothetical protein
LAIVVDFPADTAINSAEADDEPSAVVDSASESSEPESAMLAPAPRPAAVELATVKPQFRPLVIAAPAPTPAPATVIVGSSTTSAQPVAKVGNRAPATVATLAEIFVSMPAVPATPSTTPPAIVAVAPTPPADELPVVENSQPATIGALTRGFASIATTAVTPFVQVADPQPEPETEGDRHRAESPAAEEVGSRAESLLVVHQPTPLMVLADPVSVPEPVVTNVAESTDDDESAEEPETGLSLGRLFVSSLWSRVLSAIDSDVDETDNESIGIDQIDTSTALSDLVMADMGTQQKNQANASLVSDVPADSVSEEPMSVDEFFRLLAE